MAIVDTELTGNASISEKMHTMIEAARRAEADLFQTFDWLAYPQTDIPCVAGPQFWGKVLDIGGPKRVRRVKIKVRMDVLPDFGRTERPAENHIILFRAFADDPGTRYRVVNVKLYCGVILELECEDTTQTP
jgi:hypothetical protein